MIDTTNRMMFHLGNLNAENQRITYQTGTGEILQNGSDDSLVYAGVLAIEDRIRVTTNLKEQLVKTNNFNDIGDTSLSDMKNQLDTIKVNLLKGLNDGMDRSDKLALATTLRGVRETMLDLMNVKANGEFVFAGSVTTEQTMVKDADFALNGQVEYGGDGFLRKIAVQPGSYRDRGVTGYDASFYTASLARAGELFTFEEGERIIDENGNEWKLNAANTHIQQYDHNGVIIHPPVEIAIDSSTPADDAPAIAGTGQSVKATYTINNIGLLPAGRVFEAKHNYFDDLNVIINALEGQATLLDGTKGAIISDTLVDDTLRAGLDQTDAQFDATNIGHGELGGRNAVFEQSYEKIQSQLTHYNILLRETNGADLTKLAVESKALETTYAALYSTIAKMNDMSLVKYI